MALTNAGKKSIVENDWRTETMYIALSTDGSSEQSGSGYARKQVPEASGDRLVSNAGVITLKASLLPLTIYTPTDGNAGDSTHGALYDAATGGNRITDWSALSPDVAAPVQGQAYRISSFTFTP